MEQRLEIGNHRPDPQPKVPYQGIFLTVPMLGIDEIGLTKPRGKTIKELIQQHSGDQQSRRGNCKNNMESKSVVKDKRNKLFSIISQCYFLYNFISSSFKIFKKVIYLMKY